MRLPSASGVECAGALVCRADPEGEDGARACNTPGQEGEACLADWECAAELECHGTLLCGPPGAQGARCFGDEDCVAGLLCNPYYPTNVPGAGQCQPPAEAGEPCLQSRYCVDGLVCYLPEDWTHTSTEEGVCDAPHLRPDDARCWHDLECAEGVVCHRSPAAQEAGGRSCWPPGDEGDSCARAMECESDLVCADYTCRPPLEAGERCERTEQCADGLTCNFGYTDRQTADGECQPPGTVGDPCGRDEDCSGDVVCVFPLESQPNETGFCGEGS